MMIFAALALATTTPVDVPQRAWTECLRKYALSHLRGGSTEKIVNSTFAACTVFENMTRKSWDENIGIGAFEGRLKPHARQVFFQIITQAKRQQGIRDTY